ncbi:MAG: hypothetical protein E7488_02670 [Ruminococcaceae bacterium]|nr:hypothetical protein [Oscillospiraceae bacterium]
MFYREKINNFDSFFLKLSSRPNNAVFFCRLTGYSQEIHRFIREYYTAARQNGVIIDGRIPNPDQRQLEYFSEMIGNEFQNDRNFLDVKMSRWLPRATAEQRKLIVDGIYSMLQDMKNEGKNDNMLRNAYIKYMCWLYYKFERIVNKLGTEDIPKILYNGEISNYELQFMSILSKAGTDILLLEYNGDSNYLKHDPQSRYSQLYTVNNQTNFPENFNYKSIQEEIVKETNRRNVYGPLPALSAATNVWMNKSDVKEILRAANSRGERQDVYYNSFIAQYGVEDKLTFTSELMDLYSSLKADKRKICVINGTIPNPTPEEIAQISRKQYSTAEQMAGDLAKNINYSSNMELQKIMMKSFIDVIFEEENGISINKLLNRAIYLLCWLKRYQKELFVNWRYPETPVCIFFAGCHTEAEAMFVKFISRLPVDVVLYFPNLNEGNAFKPDNAVTVKYELSMPINQFPAGDGRTVVSTVAYQAERELDSLMYQNTGIYRNQQYKKAEVVVLQTMYEETSILWQQELKYRQNFSVANDVVVIPAIYEKVCGVKNGDVQQYWRDIKKLITKDTIVVKNIPWHTSTDYNPIKSQATLFLHNKKLQRGKIKAHRDYKYGILREEMQEHIFDKIQYLLDNEIISGTYRNGTEYTVIATALNLEQSIVRMIQKFDFTKTNPKLLIVNTKEQILSLEDTIIVALLNQIGFDITIFVPTGYQCVEKYFNRCYINEHNIGEYVYDLSVPDFNMVSESGGSSIRKFFGRST